MRTVSFFYGHEIHMIWNASNHFRCVFLPRWWSQNSYAFEKDMTRIRSNTWSWTEHALPFVTMLMITSCDMGVLTIVKASMNGGMNSIVYIVYHVALGILILLPFFIILIFRLFLSIRYFWHEAKTHHNTFLFWYRYVGCPRLTFHILLDSSSLPF